MICKNCNYILSGSESFCPDCGTPCVKEREYSKEPEAPSVIFSPEKESSSPIFSDEPARHLVPEKAEKKSRAGIYLAAVLCLVIIGTLAISLTGLVDFTPAIAALFPVSEEETVPDETVKLSEYDPLADVISPNVNYKTTIAYITADRGQALRKGPDSNYGQLALLASGTIVHVSGTSNVNNEWVYVYVPEEDIYGWLSGAYLTSSLEEMTEEEENSEEKETTESTPTSEETTDGISDENKN